MTNVTKMFRRRNLMNCLPMTMAALLVYSIAAFTANAVAALPELPSGSTGTILGPPRRASHSSNLKVFTLQRSSNNDPEIAMRSNRTTNSRHSQGSKKESFDGTKSTIKELYMTMTSKQEQPNPVERIEPELTVTKQPKTVTKARQVSSDTRKTPLVTSLLKRNIRDAIDGIRNKEFNFSRREGGQNLILPRTHYRGISSLRSQHYIKYPSPFPEDNTFQSYSGCANSGQCQNHHNEPTNYSHLSVNPLGKARDSSSIGKSEGTSRDIGSHSNLFELGRFAIPESNDYSFAASQMESGSQSSLGSNFPGLLGAPPIQYSSLSGPSFVPGVKEDFTAVAGATAILSCRIRNLHNYTVSWVRGRDIRLLTTGLITYTSDKRFVPSNPGRGPDWLLKIHYSRKQDAGAYLCQVSLSPPITKTVNLEVHEAVVTVQPGKEVHVQVGSTLHLECRVRGCFQPVPSWTHGGYPLPPDEISESTEEEQRVNGSVSEVDNIGSANHASAKNTADNAPAVIVGDGAESGRSTRENTKRARRSDKVHWDETGTNMRRKRSDHNGLISGDLKKEPSPKSPTLNDSMSDAAALHLTALLGLTFSSFYGASTTQLPPVISVVTVTRRGVTPQHSGIYTCTSTCTPPINVTVHILRGEELAAIHHQNAAPAPAPPSAMAFVAAIAVICFTFTYFDDCLVKNGSSANMCIGSKRSSYQKVGSSERERLRTADGDGSRFSSGRRCPVCRRHFCGGYMTSIARCFFLVNHCVPMKLLYDVINCSNDVRDGEKDFERHRKIHSSTNSHFNNKLHHVHDPTSSILIMMIYHQKESKSPHLTCGKLLKYTQLSLNQRNNFENNQDEILWARPLCIDMLALRIKKDVIQRIEARRNGVMENVQFDQFRSKSRTVFIVFCSQRSCHCSAPVASVYKLFIQCSLKKKFNGVIESHIRVLIPCLSLYVK